MNLVGLLPCRNEDWILGLSARVALKWCDRLVILLHACTDNSLEIATVLEGEFGDRVIIHWISDPSWDEMSHRQEMLAWARQNIADKTGATHIALIDADEILTGNLLGSIREHVARLSTGQMLRLPLYNLRGGLNRYHLNGIWGQRVTSVAFKDVNTAGWKGDKHHDRDPGGVQWHHVNVVNQGDGGVLHLWGASERRLIAKHALYKVRDTLRWPEKKAQFEKEYSWAIKGEPGHPRYGTPETWTYADVPQAWWQPYDKWSLEGGFPDPMMPGLVRAMNEPFNRVGYPGAEPELWQEAEVRRLVAEHGPERFEGLDLFGIA